MRKALTVFSIVLLLWVGAPRTLAQSSAASSPSLENLPQGNTGQLADLLLAMGFWKGLFGASLFLPRPTSILGGFAILPTGLSFAPFVPGALIGIMRMPTANGSLQASKMIAETATRFFVDVDDNGAFTQGECFGDVVGARRMNFSNTSSAPFFPGLFCLFLFANVLLIDEAFEGGDVSFALSGAGTSAAFLVSALLTVSILAHIAFGRTDFSAAAQGGGQALAIETTISIGNAGGQERTARIDFFTQNGQPAQVSIDGTTQSSFSFSVPPHSTIIRAVGPNAPVTTVWARGVGQELEFATTFVTRQGSGTAAADVVFGAGSGQLVGSAGLAAGTPGSSQTVPVTETSQVRTALAIANPTGQAANIRLTLKDAQDNEIDSANLNLAARSQTAQFVSTDFFSSSFPAGHADFTGSVTLRSGTDFSVLTLETNDLGIQQASLPAAVFTVR